MARELVVFRPSEVGPQLIRAAEYLRMSTQHQRYSIANQKQVIDAYARSHSMIIVETYADGGKSGLTLSGRSDLQRLLRDVASGQATYQVVLVYDVSRWGRFQDTDESATYEFLCRRRGIKVIYCAEPFFDDSTPMADILKSVKRGMAAEKSRELSEKVHRGQCRLVTLGYNQGGEAPYGLRRLLLDESGEPRFVMRPRQRKNLKTDRVVLVHGPARERAVVRAVFRMFADEKRSTPQIVAELNRRGIKNAYGRPWRRWCIHNMLKNEKYIGNMVWNRVSLKLKTPRKKNAPSEWVRADGSIEPIISLELWQRTQARFASAIRKMSNYEALQKLRKLLERTGYLTGEVIDAAEGMPSSQCYRSRFNGLDRAFEHVGYTSDRYVSWGKSFGRNQAIRNRVRDEILHGFVKLGAFLESWGHLIRVDGQFSVAVVTACHRLTCTGQSRWLPNTWVYKKVELYVVVRLDRANREIMDYYLIPDLGRPIAKSRIGGIGHEMLEIYRSPSLQPLFHQLAESRATSRSFMECHRRWAAQNRPR